MKPQTLLFWLLFAISANLFTAAKAQVDVNDSLALVDLYKKTNGSDWITHTNWLTKKPVSTWYGVKVADARVIELNLYWDALRGKLPASIGDLTSLVSLQLQGNYLYGGIPSAIGNLVNLAFLELSYNYHLGGSIPASIGKLINLKELNIGQAELDGMIPATVGNLSSLTHLHLGVNKLSGAILASIGKLINLESLSLGSNQLSGSIPASIGKLINLESLSLYANQFKGVVPYTIGNLVNLGTLSLDYNQLTGDIPPSIGKLVNLQHLGLSYNELSGGIPYTFRNLKNLNSLSLDHNQLAIINNVDFAMAAPSDAYIDVSYNHTNFNGLEYAVEKYKNITYVHQAVIPVLQQGNTLSVYAGGTMSNNTYKWYKAGQAGSFTKMGDSTFVPAESGKYYAQVTNAKVTIPEKGMHLVLFSDTIDFMMSEGTADNRLTTETNSKTKLFFKVSPNPASSTLTIKLNGTANIIITSSAGKVMLQKNITNNAVINVSSYSNGIYYIKNITSGEVHKIVLLH